MTLDVITIGRSSVDLYGAQVGGRLEDMSSFRKYIGGSPTNIAAGSARLGLKSAVITKVGDEQFNLNPMGSGPYKFVSWQKGVKVETEANDDYWRGQPPFPRVEYHAVKDAATRVADLRTGKITVKAE